MSILIDRDIDRVLRGPAPIAGIVVNNTFSPATSHVQAASLDLTIGEIFVPGTAPNDPGGVNTPRTMCCLPEGHTVVVRTAETVTVPDGLMAVGFPPSSLSTKGILMTNPGIVDPGYTGPLHLTIINMGREPFPLMRGDRVIRLVFFELNGLPGKSYAVRHPGPPEPVITDELLRKRLSEDFVDVEKRAEKIVSDALKQAAFWATGIAALISLLGVVVQHYNQNSTALQTRLTAIEGDLSATKTDLKVLNAAGDFTKLNERMDQFEIGLKNSVTAINTNTKAAIDASTKSATDTATNAANEAVRVGLAPYLAHLKQQLGHTSRNQKR